MCVYGVFKNPFNLVYSLLLAHFFIRVKAWLKVTCSFNLAVTVPEVVTGHKAVHTLKEGFGGNCVLERKIGIKRFCIELLYKLRVFKNTLDFTAVDKILADLRVVHRLDSEKVTCYKYRLVLCVVDCKAEHTTKLRQ